MVGEVLQGVGKRIQEAADSEASKLADVERNRGQLESKVSEAEATEVEAEKLVEVKKAALVELGNSMSSAKAALSEAQELQRSGDSLMEQTERSKTEMEKCIQTDFSNAVPEDQFNALLPTLQSLDLDGSLMVTLPGVCAKSAESRGAFDVMVIDQLKTSLQTKLAELVQKLQSEAPAKASRAAAVDAAEKKLVEAQDSQQRGSDEADAAVADQQNASSAVAVAKEALAAHGPTYKEATEARDAKQLELENFQNYSMGCFELLRDYKEAGRSSHSRCYLRRCSCS